METVTLVLFDIDGTLLNVHGAGRAAFAQTVKAIYGWQDELDYIQFAGATDLDVLRKIVRRHGYMPNIEDEQRFFAHLPKALENTTVATKPTLFPGVRPLLEALGQHPRAMVGLVTGNIEACAKIKLGRLGIGGHFTLGAFGEEHADRCQIAALALRRAAGVLRERGQGIGARFLVGDTPSDMAAAEAIGARGIGVATGTHSAEDLKRAGADAVFKDLSNLDALLETLNLTSSSVARREVNSDQ